MNDFLVSRIVVNDAFSAKYEDKPYLWRIHNLLENYYNLYESIYDGSSRSPQTHYMVRGLDDIQQQLKRENILYYHIPLLSQDRNDCWHQAARKIMWASNLHRPSSMSQWRNAPNLLQKWENGAFEEEYTPFVAWQKDQGVKTNDTNKIMQALGFKPLPDQLVFRRDNGQSDLEKREEDDWDLGHITRYLKKLTSHQIRKYLMTYGPLWVAVKCSGGEHIMALVGVGNDCIIFNDSMRGDFYEAVYKSGKKKAVNPASRKDRGVFHVFDIDTWPKLLSIKTFGPGGYISPVWYYPEWTKQELDIDYLNKNKNF